MVGTIQPIQAGSVMPSKRDKNDTWRSRIHPIKEDMAFQRATWRAERIGWTVLWLIVVLALLGLFSNGLLSTASVESPAGDLRVTYERFQRNGTLAEIKLEAAPQSGQQLAIRIGTQILDASTIETITPRPQAERGIAGGIEFVFAVEPGEPLTVYVNVRPRGVGFLAGGIGIGESRPARLSQFIYP
jgi:hypothetical protein